MASLLVARATDPIPEDNITDKQLSDLRFD